VGVSQHHDAITGTEKDAVTADYMTNLSSSTTHVSNSTSAVIGALLDKSGGGVMMPRTVDGGMLSLLGHPNPCGGGSGPSPPPSPPGPLGCVMWRETKNCDATGHDREPKNDKPCAMPIKAGLSGYCECTGGAKRMLVGCGKGRHEFTCNEVCRGDAPPPPSPAHDASCFGLHPAPAEFKTTAVVLHNTLGWNVTHTARVVVNRTDLVVTDASGALVPSQINPLPAYAPEMRSDSFRTGQHFFDEMSNALEYNSASGSFALFLSSPRTSIGRPPVNSIYMATWNQSASSWSSSQLPIMRTIDAVMQYARSGHAAASTSSRLITRL
jgi:hypothetical protein